MTLVLAGLVRNTRIAVESKIKMLTENSMLTSFTFDYLNNVYEEKLNFNSIIKKFLTVQKEINN